uniref:SCP domain-containing protein n=1 Tax=Terrapene triunguis TaxID=2587831 RepID=A0A674JT94_9SAUR
MCGRDTGQTSKYSEARKCSCPPPQPHCCSSHCHGGRKRPMAKLGSCDSGAPEPPEPGPAAGTQQCARCAQPLASRVWAAAQLTWDAALARTARAWAKKCLFKHSPYLTEKFMSHPHYGHVGENIWTGHYGLFGVPEAIKLWTDEVQHYNLQTNKCTKTCGHYTQVVWDNSHKVGCAVVFCRIAAGIRDAAHFVCNYVPR